MTRPYAPVRSMSTDADLPSPTAAALLGLLAQRARPTTTYELTKEMARNLRFFWPRAESRIYAHAKELVDRGWARAEQEVVGRRPRTLYEVTPAGRRALAAWLGAAPASMTTPQSQGLVGRPLAPGGPRGRVVAAPER